MKDIMATPMAQQKKVGAALIGACLLWLCAASAGLSLLWGYKNLPGEAGAPPTSWPVGSSLRREEGRATLVSGAAGQTETRVFGCPLFSPDSECRAGQEADHANHKN